MAKKRKNTAQNPGTVQNKEAHNSDLSQPSTSQDTEELDRLTSPYGAIAQLCDEGLQLFCKGGRANLKAKKALQKLAKTYPESPLPQRYLARVLYHEASMLEPTDPTSPDNNRRLELLLEALAAASAASEVCPQSLSCAVLRATLVVNVLVEKSTSLVGSLAPGRQGLPTGQQCEEMRLQFKEASECCERVLSQTDPIQNEPVVNISAGAQKTSDPCCLRIQDRIQTLISNRNWSEIVKEKQYVLRSMHEVLNSCHQLLNTTQAPQAGVSNAINNILRAGLTSPCTQPLDKNAMAELMKRLKARPGEDTGLPPPLRAPPMDLAPSSLSIERDPWEQGKDMLAAARRKQRGKGLERRGGGQEVLSGAVKDYWSRLGPQERQDLLAVPVREMLAVARQEKSPAAVRELEYGLLLMTQTDSKRAVYWTCPHCAAAQPEKPLRFATGREFADHAREFHEEVATSAQGDPLVCAKCGKDVVGVHYESLEVPPSFLCLHCFHDEGGPHQFSHLYQRVTGALAVPAVPWDDSEHSSLKGSGFDSEEGGEDDTWRAGPDLLAATAGPSGDVWGAPLLPPPLPLPQGHPGPALFAGFGGEAVNGYPATMDSNAFAQPGHTFPMPMPAGLAGPGTLQHMLRSGQGRGGVSSKRIRRKVVAKRPTEARSRQAVDEDPGMSEASSEEEGVGQESANGDFEGQEGVDPWQMYQDTPWFPGVSALTPQLQAFRAGFMDAPPVAPPPRFDGPYLSAMSVGHIPGIGLGTEAVAPHGGASALWMDQANGFAHGLGPAPDPAHPPLVSGPYYASDPKIVGQVMKAIDHLYISDPAAFPQRYADISGKLMSMLKEQGPEGERAQAAHFHAQDFPLDSKEAVQAALLRLRPMELHKLLVYMGRHSDLGRPRGSFTASNCSSAGYDEDIICQPLFRLKAQPLGRANDQTPPSNAEVGRAWEYSLARPDDQPRELADASDFEFVLSVKEWWLNHLLQKGREEREAEVADGRMLRWIYGSVVLTAAHEFAERQRELRGERRLDQAILDLYQDLAYSWRHLHKVVEHRHVVKNMRRAVDIRMREVKELEALGPDKWKEVAKGVADALRTYVTAFPPDGRPPELWQAAASPARWGPSSFDPHSLHPDQHNFHEPAAARYALSLLELQLAVVELQTAMLEQDVKDLQKESQAADERLKKAKIEQSEAKDDLQRLESEGPANHRKRDPLDKATKEVEHRTKCEDLKATIHIAKDNVALLEQQASNAKMQECLSITELETTRISMREVREHMEDLKAVCQACKDCDGSAASISAVYCSYYVAQAVHVYGPCCFTVPGTPEFVAYTKCEERVIKLYARFQEEIQRYNQDLDRTRHKLQELACVDLSLEVGEAALAVVRQRLDVAATLAKEEASARLLQELEDEDRAKEAARKEAEERQKAKKSKGKKKGGQQDAFVKNGGASTAGSDAGSGTGFSSATNAPPLSAEARKQAEDAAYEAALRERKAALEAREAELIQQEIDRLERLRLAEEQESAAGSVAEEQDGYDSLSEDEEVSGRGSSIATAPATATSLVDEDEFEAATRAAIELSLRMYEAEQKAAGQKMEQANGDWQEVGKDGAPEQEKKKKKNRKQRYKENLEKEKEVMALHQMKIVSYLGDWKCECGTTNRLWDACSCGKAGPCRDWVRGRCKYKTACRFPHPPFCMPSGPAPPSPIARPPTDDSPPVPRAKAVPAMRAVDDAATPVATAAPAVVPQRAAPDLAMPGPPAAPRAVPATLPPAAPMPPPPVPNAWAVRPAVQVITGGATAAHAPASVAPPQPTPAVSGAWGRPVDGSAGLASAPAAPQPAAAPPPFSLFSGGWPAPQNAAEAQPPVVQPSRDQVVAPPKRSAPAASSIPILGQGATTDQATSWSNFGSSLLGGWSTFTTSTPLFSPFLSNPLGQGLAEPLRPLPTVAPEAVERKSNSVAPSRFSLPASLDDDSMDTAHTVVQDVINKVIDTPEPQTSDGGLPLQPARTAEPLPEPKARPPIPRNASAFGINPAATPFTPLAQQRQAAEGRRTSSATSMEGMLAIASQQWGMPSSQALSGVSAGAPATAAPAARELPSQALQNLVPPQSAAPRAPRPGAPGAPPHWALTAQEGFGVARSSSGGLLFGASSSALPAARPADAATPSFLQRTASEQMAAGQRASGQRHDAAKEGHVGVHMEVGSSEFLGFLYSLALALWNIACFRDSLLRVEMSNLPDSHATRVMGALRAVLAEMSKSSAAHKPGPARAPWGPLGAYAQGQVQVSGGSTNTSYSSFSSVDGTPSLGNGLASLAGSHTPNSGLSFQQPNPCAVPDELLTALWRQLSAAGLLHAAALLDSSEALEALLACLEVAVKKGLPSNAVSPIQRIFGLSMNEVSECINCRRSGRMQYVKFTQLVRTRPLREEWLAASRPGGGRAHARLEGLLHKMASNAGLTCMINEGGCGYPMNVSPRVEGPPLAFALALVWDTPPTDASSTMAVCQLLATELDLGQVYNGLGMSMWRLRVMICMDPNKVARTCVCQDGYWRSFEVQSVKNVGDWSAALTYCRLNLLQPQTLLYEMAS